MHHADGRVHSEYDRRTVLDVGRVAFRNGELDFQGRYFCQLGDNCRGGGIGSFADITKADNPVERRPELGLGNIGFYQFDVRHQLFIFGSHLFISLLTDRVLFQKRMLAVHAIFG